MIGTTRRGRLGPHTVNRVGFGAMQLAGPGVLGPPADPAAARAVLRRAVELGVDHIDTAQYYGPNVVNELIRDALHPYPAGLRLVSKVGARRDRRGAALPATHPDELRAGVEANLQTLQVDALALVNLRLMGGRCPAGRAARRAQVAPGRGQDRSDRYQQRERRRSRGRPRDCRPRRGPERLQRQGPGRRGRPELLRRARHRLRPVLPDRLARGQAPISSVAAKHGATPAQIALAWLLHKGPHVLLIPGTSSMVHLEQNIAAARIALDDDDLAALDGVWRPSASDQAC